MDMLATLLPLVIMYLLLFLFAVPLIRRKGVSMAHLLWLLIPFVGVIALIRIVALPDKTMEDEPRSQRANTGH